MKAPKYNVGDKVNIIKSGQLIDATIMKCKKTLFGNYKYLCKYNRDNYRYGILMYTCTRAIWIKENNIYNVDFNSVNLTSADNIWTSEKVLPAVK